MVCGREWEREREIYELLTGRRLGGKEAERGRDREQE